MARRLDWRKARKDGRSIEFVWESEPEPTRRTTGLLHDPTLRLQRLRDEFASLPVDERGRRSAEFRERMNSLSVGPGDHPTLWNLRFAPLVRGQGVAPIAIEGRPGAQHRDVAGASDERVPTDSGFQMERAGQRDARVSVTPRGQREVLSTCFLYSLVHTTALQCDVALVWARNGERWVEAENVLSAFPMLHQLDRRFRLIIDECLKGAYCNLRVVRPKMDGRLSLVTPSMRELSAATQLSVSAELRHAGATDVGTRQTVLGDTGRMRDGLIATFPDENEAVPVLAYALTRFAPLLPSP